MNYFFSYLIDDDELLLDGDEARHCIKVLRRQIGDLIEVLDGKGRVYHCRIKEIRRHAVLASIQSANFYDLGQDPQLTIAISPLKNQKRFEWFLEKSTELGISRIVPLLCHRTEKTRIKRERWWQIMVAAMKQSGRYYLPILNDLTDYDKFIAETTSNTGKYIGYCAATLPKFQDYLPGKYKGIRVLIGPEGDFTPDEYQRALEAGYKGVSLGPNRYRTETAGMLVAALVHSCL